MGKGHHGYLNHRLARAFVHSDAEFLQAGLVQDWGKIFLAKHPWLFLVIIIVHRLSIPFSFSELNFLYGNPK